jgi:hypothetical protein
VETTVKKKATKEVHEDPNAILICGDNHGQFDHILEAALRLKPRAVISVGDLQAREPLEVELAPLLKAGVEFWWIPGNHDTDSEADYRNLCESGLADRNLHGRVVQIGPYRVAGLGGVFRQDVWGPPTTFTAEAALHSGANFERYEDYVASLKRRTPPRAWQGDPAIQGNLRKHKSTIFPSVYRRLLKERADILVTHEAGAWAHRYGHGALDHLAERLGARLHFAGHHHCFRRRSDAEGNRAYVVGLRAIVNLAGETVREGELDRKRPDPDVHEISSERPSITRGVRKP